MSFVPLALPAPQTASVRGAGRPGAGCPPAVRDLAPFPPPSAAPAAPARGARRRPSAT